MKLTLAVLSTLTIASSAFAPAATFSRGLTKTFAEEEEGGLDLNLEEMFDMFDAADKGKDFDDAIKKVKGDDKKSK